MKLRFLIISGLIICMSIGLSFYANAAAQLFSDVPDTNVYARAINSLKQAEIIKGYTDGTFKPDKPISRAEAVAIILKAAGINAEKSDIKMPFTDVKEGAWFFPAIQKGVELQKLQGFPDKTFRPNASTTLAESLVLTLSFFKIDLKTTYPEALIYDGLDPKEWYAKQAQYAKNQNIIEPNGNEHVEPHKAISRGQFADIIFRMRTVRDTGKPFDITFGWVFTENANNNWKLKHPKDWEIFKGLSNSVIWKRADGQVFFTRIWPGSARLSITLDSSSEFLPSQYFEKLKITYTSNYKKYKTSFSDVTVSGKTALRITIPELHIIDLAIALPNKQFLVMYGEYGDAPIGEFLKKQLDAIELSYEFMEKPPVTAIPLEDRMATLRESVLVKNKGANALSLFPDKKLISIDAIGIGTGPVDYYYSKEADYTIKFERNSGIILNIKAGKTNAF